MTGLYKGFLVIVAIVTAIPVAAQTPGPATTALDGFYAGVSREASRYGYAGGGETRCEIPNGVPAPLTITGGVVRSTPAGPGWEGTVSPQGVIVIHARN